MAGKGRQTPRKPATKFAHLRKKMERARIAAKYCLGKNIEPWLRRMPESFWQWDLAPFGIHIAPVLGLLATVTALGALSFFYGGSHYSRFTSDSLNAGIKWRPFPFRGAAAIRELAARVIVAACDLVWFAAIVGTILACFVSLWRSTQTPKYITYVLIVILVSGLVNSGFVSDSPTTNQNDVLKLKDMLHSRVYKIEGLKDFESWTSIGNWLALYVVLLFSIAVAEKVGRNEQRATTARILKQKYDDLDGLLTVGAILLIAGGVYVAASENWPSAVARKNDAAALSRFATAVTLMYGSLFTTILASIYVPAIAVLRRRGKCLAVRSVPGGDYEDCKAWLASNGLIASTAEEVRALLKIGAPLIAGGALPTLVQLIFGK